MKVLAVAEPDPDVHVPDSHDRPAGVHVSDIIKKLLIERDAVKYGSNSPIDADTIERGYVWEEVLSDALTRRYGGENGFRPETFQVDGVWMSPDWVNPESEFPLEEWKATRVSKKSDVTDKHWYWFIQIACYLKGLRWNKATLRVWYINGDYGEAAKVDPRALTSYVRYHLEFTQREIDENWQMLMGAARKYGLLPHDPPTWADAVEVARERKAVRESWANTETNQSPEPTPMPATQSPQRSRLTKTRNSPAPQPLLAQARVLTFPNTKASKRITRNAS